MAGINFIIGLPPIDIVFNIIKLFFISICIYFTIIKLTNTKNVNIAKNIMIIIQLFIMSVICESINNLFNSFNCIIALNFLLILIYKINFKNNIGYSILITLISSGINYGLFFISIALSFIPIFILNIRNNFISLVIIIVINIILLYLFLKSKKLKNGIIFLEKNMQNDFIDILILNISVTILLSIIIFINSNMSLAQSLAMGLIVFLSIMFITIQKSLQLYYKQKLLIRELNETKEELDKKSKEIEELEKENIEISKKRHTLVHKQKSLEYKLEKMMNKEEISVEEAAEVKERLREIQQDLYKEKSEIKLDKTGITKIDDILEYMQVECKKNKIDFELQIQGNIHYMINNLITAEDLETLIADHVKNSIIAIKHTKNINRSILVRLGEIDKIYSLYIYDSGVEFEKETLENLGLKPSTTHAEEGGTGMGFMNTFDTLRKCKASLIINEFNEPSKDNYTKAIIIKFDEKNEFKINSYKDRTKN